MLLKDFKEIADELGLPYYQDKDAKDYSITLDTLEDRSHNHIATWDGGKVVAYEMPRIDIDASMVRCGADVYDKKLSTKENLRKYVKTAMEKYKELKKEMRFRKIREL